MKTIQVKDADIRIKPVNEEDYICLTDIAKGVQGEDHIKNWMRNRNTLEYIGVWEQLNNPKFKGVEFDTFKQEAGLNRFTMPSKKWIAATDANPKRVLAGENIRDMASINELTILSNLEQTNALLMKQGVEKVERFHLLQEMAQAQKQRLNQLDLMKSIKRTTPEVFLGLDKQ